MKKYLLETCSYLALSRAASSMKVQEQLRRAVIITRIAAAAGKASKSNG
jgi:hypothetical protein